MSRTARPTRCARLALERLDDRAVPATLVDLGSAGAVGEADGALFLQGDAPPAGARPACAFLRLHAGRMEHGYNTDARPVQFDEKDSPTTCALTLGQVPVVIVDGVAYREFLLSIDQASSAGGALLSLDELRIYSGSTGNLWGYDPSAHTLAGLSPLYDMDGAGNVTVKLDDRLAADGTWDVRVLIPDALFTGLTVTDYVYLYSKLGGTWAANAGAEVWAVRPGTPTPGPSPDPGTLSGYVYADMDQDGAREPDRNEEFVAEYGIAGVNLHLTGTNNLGNAVDLWTTTDASGYYEFAELRPGTYTITRPELEPGTPFFDGLNHVGSAGGVSNESNTEPDLNGPDMIYDVALAGGVSGTEYNFGMLGG
jgi:hypothetical protein